MSGLPVSYGERDSRPIFRPLLLAISPIVIWYGLVLLTAFYLNDINPDVRECLLGITEKDSVNNSNRFSKWAAIVFCNFNRFGGYFKDVLIGTWNLVLWTFPITGILFLIWQDKAKRRSRKKA